MRDMWLLLGGVAVAFQCTTHIPPTTVTMRGYADAKAAAAERRAAPEATVSSAPPPPMETPPTPQEEEPTVAPSESVRKVLEVLGSRIGSNGRPLPQKELETFKKDVDRVIKGLEN